ncbi:MAG: hypothetical protein GY874_08885 [Desulfobacteraceae bacterium]|nr:hypothetical protein [Desulfobacteraceae bacterium]
MQKKGRILKVKQGYNPNSSSVGSDLPLFLAFAAGSGILAIVVMTIFHWIDKTIRRDHDS